MNNEGTRHKSRAAPGEPSRSMCGEEVHPGPGRGPFLCLGWIPTKDAKSFGQAAFSGQEFLMARHRLLGTVVTAAVSLALAGAGLTTAGAAAAASRCSAGAHTLAPAGSHVYPETGNGGYASVHTDVHMVYDATTNMFLPGNNVALTSVATQCLTSFSLDFERQSPNTSDGPMMTVDSVTVNGAPATFAFVQPTYPGDPNGQDD